MSSFDPEQMKNLHAARWDSCQSGGSNRPHRTYPLVCKKNHIDDFPKKNQYLPFWNCHKLQFLYPPECSEGVSPLVHKALEGRVKDSVSHGRSFLVAFPPLSGTPVHLPPYLRCLSQLAIKNSSVSCTETSAFAPSPICTCAMYINTLA